MNPARIDEEFPAPSYRGAQAEALGRIRAAFEAGNDVVLVRAPTGSGKSLLDLFKRAAADAPDWFAEQVERTSRPDLPAFDPGAAAAGAAGASSGSRSDARGSRSGGDGSRSDSGGTAQRSASRRSTASGDGKPTSLDDHPLGDVWGTD